MLKFVDKKSLVEFLQHLPKSLDFKKLLQEDFGKESGNYDAEWLWKYFTRKQFLSEDEYPIDRTYDIYQVDMEDEVHTTININPNKKGLRVKSATSLDGKCTIKYNVHINKFEGFIGDTLISSSKSKDFVVSRLEKFGMKEFEELN